MRTNFCSNIFINFYETLKTKIISTVTKTTTFAKMWNEKYKTILHFDTVPNIEIEGMLFLYQIEKRKK